MKLFKIRIQLIPVIFLMGVVQAGCKKFVEVKLPIDKNTSETVFNNTALSVAAMTGVYGYLANVSELSGGFNGLSITTSLMTDELTPIIPEYWPAYTNTVNSYSFDIWTTLYNPVIYRVNSIIEKLNASKEVPSSSKEILTSEAKFVRALAYFYLVNFYGDVPLVLTTDFKINSNIPRTDKLKVYDQIVADLLDAQAGLKDDYLDVDLLTPTPERIRPNKAAATALLARVYLFIGKWIEAEQEASKIINNTAQYDTVALDKVFLKNSKEAIWQLQPNPLEAEGANTKDGRSLAINPFEGKPTFKLSSFLLSSFEANDKRKDAWFSVQGQDTLAYKYKAGWFVTDQIEYSTILRLAEQYLIRAEARAQQGKLTGENSAVLDLNIIRRRAGLGDVEASGKDDILEAIFNERYVELFSEYGHRWLDLKRTGKLDARMQIVTPIKGGIWASYQVLWPIPYAEFEKNPALRGHQNPGYKENQ